MEEYEVFNHISMLMEPREGMTIVEYTNYCRKKIYQICADLQAKVDLANSTKIDLVEGACPQQCRLEFYGRSGSLEGVMSDNEHIILCLVIDEELQDTIVT